MLCIKNKLPTIYYFFTQCRRDKLLFLLLSLYLTRPISENPSYWERESIDIFLLFTLFVLLFTLTIYSPYYLLFVLLYISGPDKLQSMRLSSDTKIVFTSLPQKYILYLFKNKCFLSSKINTVNCLKYNLLLSG